jgi:hypothetical protein
LRQSHLYEIKANGGHDGDEFPKHLNTCVVPPNESVTVLLIPKSTVSELVLRKHAGSVGRFLDAARRQGIQEFNFN